MKALLVLVLLVLGVSPAFAKHHHPAVAGHHHRLRHAYLAHGEAPIPTRSAPAGIVTVQTAAGIPITVASNLAQKFEGLISDMVAEGYRPRSIGCFARGGHVSNSNHYHGGACDFDQRARNRAPSFMYHIASLAAKWGLRDGCTFHDCGHIDDGLNVGWRRRYASR